MRIDLDALFASAPSPYVLLDADLRIVWANDTYLKVTGRTLDTLINRVITEAFPAPADSVSDQMLRGSLRRVLETGKTDHLPLIPYPIERAPGQFDDCFWSATHTPVLDEQGDVTYILQNTIDVTDLYQSKDAADPDDLRERAALMIRAEAVATENLALETMTDFFQSAFDQAPSFMAILNGPDHVFQIVNQAYTDLIGGRDVIGVGVREALPEIEGQGFLELLDQVFATGESVTFRGMAARIKRGFDADPEQLFVDFIFHPLIDETQNCIGIFVQGHDVTGQKTAEASLAVTREKFRAMAQTMPNHVWTADPDGGLNWLSDQIYAYTGASEGALYGADWVRVVHPDDEEVSSARWATTISNGVAYESEFRIRKADGSYRWHLVRASPLRAEDGTLTGWVGTNTDIEERKNSEAEIAKLNATLETRVAKRNAELEELHATLRQSQKMEAIGNLAGGIAHDFNNLLQVITGNLQLAGREMAQGSPGQARLDQAMKSVMRGATLASQLLSFARKQPLDPVVINLTRLLTETSDILRSALGEGVKLEIDLADDLWNTSVDPNNMENALLNMALNARDAMEGQGEFTVSVRNVDLDQGYFDASLDVTRGQYVMLAVTDTGCGIDPDVIEHIFEPFFTTKEEGLGTGLGLSMVYGFAKQSGGHVTIQSEAGKGTTIKIYLPRSFGQEQVLPFVAPIGISGGSETILLVEDDPNVRETAYVMLTEMGYHVLQASDAQQALDIAKTGAEIDLLFTDVVMPGKTNGQELAERIRDIHPDLPVLFTSGYVQDSIMHDGRLNEGVQLLGKPYTQSALAQKIRNVLGGTGKPIPASLPLPISDAQPVQPEPTLFDDLCILVCEDDILIRMDIAEGLSHVGCRVLQAGNVARALDILAADPVQMLITDVGLPDRTGEELAQEARKLYPDLPVIFATGGMDVPSASGLGNCKILSKPFSDTDLLDAIKTMMSAR